MSEQWQALHEQENEYWLTALVRWLGGPARPALGWGVLLVVALLTSLPAVAVLASRWLPAGRFTVGLILLGPLAVLLLWVLAGWRNGRAPPSLLHKAFRIGIISLLYLLLGAFALTNLLDPWLPSSGALQAAWQARDVAVISAEVAANWSRLAGRFALWGAGVAAAAAPRDNLVLAAVVGVVVWLLAGVTVTLARATRRGLVTALPLLWLVALLLLYSPADRWVFLLALALALILHLLLNQQRLVASWQRRRLDYSPSLFVEQNGVALAAIALLLAAAALMPNLYLYELTVRYYALIEPVNQRLEAGVERLFPGLTRGAMPWGRGLQAGGLPNEFLLGAGQESLQRVVMRVRTDEPTAGFSDPPRSHNLRGATYSDYDGLGWANPPLLDHTQFDPEAPWDDQLPGGHRRSLLQSVNLEAPSAILFAAGEPRAPAIGYTAVTRAAGDLVSLNAAARSYTVQSAVPALDTAALAALPWWDAANPLPPDYARHLQLPDSVPARTRALAADLVAGANSPYTAAMNIEAYLRTFPYDLTVPAPPPGVVDVADYFLFDLQRGYCDYYATAFVVLARAAGLPARFATGFGAGDWSAPERQWVVTEANAHSWPEVYFPEVGWIAFEPTASLPLPERRGQPVAAQNGAAAAPTFEPLAPPAADTRAVWLMAVLLIGAAVAGMFMVVWRMRQRPDPWQAVLAWGGRAGAPLGEGETPLEYGARLAGVVQAHTGERDPELARIVGRELRELGDAVSVAQYGPAAARAEPVRQIYARWRGLRAYLNQVKLRPPR